MKSAELLYEELCTKLLGEAPITDVSVASKDFPEIPKKQPSRLAALKQDTKNNRADLRLMGNPRYLERLSAETARNIPFNIRLILVDLPAGELFDYIGRIYRQQKQTTVSLNSMNKLAEFAWPPTADTITLVLGPTGEPMKLSANKKGAWLVGHKLGHAMFDSVNIRGNEEMKENANVYSSIEREIIHYYSKYYTKLSPEEQRYPKDMRFKMFAKTISKFESAQTGTLLSTEEYIFELVAQYVMFGKVTFHYTSAYTNQVQVFESQEEANKVADLITKMIIAGFRNVVGKTIVDVG